MAVDVDADAVDEIDAQIGAGAVDAGADVVAVAAVAVVAVVAVVAADAGDAGDAADAVGDVTAVVAGTVEQAGTRFQAPMSTRDGCSDWNLYRSEISSNDAVSCWDKHQQMGFVV